MLKLSSPRPTFSILSLARAFTGNWTREQFVLLADSCYLRLAMSEQHDSGGRDTLIQHSDDLGTYSPPGHTGTVNVCLVDRDFCGAFEMILGAIAPGGGAELHHHEREHQIIYILEGYAEIELGEDAPVRCGGGMVIRIPPGLDHRIVSVGETPLELIVIYCPPLAAAGG